MAETLQNLINQGVIPNPVTFVAQIISTIILFLFLRKLVWKPMQELLEKRRKVIVGELESARALNEEAAQKQEMVNQELANIKLEAGRLLEDAKQQAEQTRLSLVEAAEQEAVYIKEKAQQEIEREKKQAQANIKQQAVEIGFTVAEKLLQNNLRDENNQQMIDNLLKEVGDN